MGGAEKSSVRKTGEYERQAAMQKPANRRAFAFAFALALKFTNALTFTLAA
jgi:hypothetical protein